MSVRTLSECIRGSIVSFSISRIVSANGLQSQSQLNLVYIALTAYNYVCLMYVGLARGQGLCVCTANVIQRHMEHKNTKPLC